LGKDVWKCGEGDSFRGRKDKVELEQKYWKEEKGEMFLYTRKLQGKRGWRIGKKKERRNKEKKNTVVGREGWVNEVKSV
jgi:hypothetical protein